MKNSDNFFAAMDNGGTVRGRGEFLCWWLVDSLSSRSWCVVSAAGVEDLLECMRILRPVVRRSCRGAVRCTGWTHVHDDLLTYYMACARP
jgi:hypothetical protein